MITLSDFRRLIAPLQRKLYLLIGRSILAAVKNTETTQKIQVTGLAGETITDTERFQEYGLETYPLADAEVLSTYLNGNRDAGIVVCVHDRRYRLTDLISGEVSLYTSEDQLSGRHRVHLKNGQIVEIKCLVSNVVAVNEINETTTDKTETISNDKIETIGNNKSETVTGNKTNAITGNKINTIGGNKTNTITGNKVETAVNITGTASAILQLGGATLIISGTNISIRDDTGVTVSTGNIKATTGHVEDSAGTMAEMRSIYNSHTHNETGTVTNSPNQPMT